MRRLFFAFVIGCGSADQSLDGDMLPDDDGGSDGSGITLDGVVLSDGGEDDAMQMTGCSTLPNGAVCQNAPDPCHTDGVCMNGVCVPPAARADGFNWKQGDEFARCCGGKAITTNTNNDCGVCGIKCNLSNGESCQMLGGRWFCRGCNTSAGCWSKCCSLSFSPPSCAASDCMGSCSAQYCPKNTVCKLGMGTSSNYCAYP